MQVGFEFRNLLKHFKGSALAVFMCIVLHSDQNGKAHPGYEVIQAETGLFARFGEHGIELSCQAGDRRSDACYCGIASATKKRRLSSAATTTSFFQHRNKYSNTRMRSSGSIRAYQAKVRFFQLRQNRLGMRRRRPSRSPIFPTQENRT